MPNSRKNKAYGEDLAYVHDVGFGWFARSSAPGLLDTLRRSGIDAGRVIDIGSGSGIWLEVLAREGYDPVGVDFSADMIKIARKRVPSAKFHRASFLKFKPPRCRAVTAMGEVFCYRLDKSHRKPALIGVWRKIYDALEPGGLLIFDMADVGLDRGQGPRFFEGPDWMCLTHSKYDERRDQLTRYITTFRRRGQSWRRHDEEHCLQLFDPKKVAEMLRAIGFRVRRVRRYGDYDLLPGRSGFIARKP